MGIEDETIRLAFIKLIGEETNGEYRYEFIFTHNIDEFWCENAEYKPCCLVSDLTPIESYVAEIRIVNTKIKLDLIQDNCCFGFQDCTDGIVSLAWENMDNYSDYPEDGRLFFRFGETFEEVEEKLAIKNLIMTIKN